MENTNLINAKIIAIMRAVEPIAKAQRNSGQGYNFRGIDDVMNEVHPKFAEHGVFITTTVLEQLREDRKTNNGGNLIYSVLKVRFEFHAEDGSSRTCEMVGEGMDSGDKASNKALSAALKYAILQMLMIPTSDDSEKDNHETAPPDSRALPGSKADKKAKQEKSSFTGNWRDAEWTLPFGNSKDKTIDYKGMTLGQIHQQDPTGLAYWIHNYTPKPHRGSVSPKD